MKKKVLSYVALSSALLTAAPLLGNVTANAATTNNNTTSSSAKVSSSSSSAKESSKVSATSSSKAADKKAARSAVRANNFAETVSTFANSNKAQNLSVKPADIQNMLNYYKDLMILGDNKSDFEHNTTIVPNLNSNKFDIVYVDAGNGTKEPQLDYNGQPFTGFDVQDGIFWDDGAPYTLAALEKAGIKVPQNIINAMKQAEANKANAKINNGNVRLTNNGIRTYGYSHYVANVNAKTLPNTGESNSIISLLKALF